MLLGKKLFTTLAVPACAVCHTLKDAGAEGAVGPVLDELKPDAARVSKALAATGSAACRHTRRPCRRSRSPRWRVMFPGPAAARSSSAPGQVPAERAVMRRRISPQRASLIQQIAACAPHGLGCKPFFASHLGLRHSLQKSCRGARPAHTAKPRAAGNRPGVEHAIDQQRQRLGQKDAG